MLIIGIVFFLIILFITIYGAIFGDFFEDLPAFSPKYSTITKYGGKNPNFFIFMLYSIIYVFMTFILLGSYIVSLFKKSSKHKFEPDYSKLKISMGNIKTFFAILLIILLTFTLILFIAALVEITLV